MGILGLFKKKSGDGEAPDKRILLLKNKRINCCYEDFDALVREQSSDESRASRLVPVNYYAVKSKYIEAQYFYSEDYHECYVRFCAYENDRLLKKSGVFEISDRTLVKAFAKVGIIVRLSDKNE